MSNTEELMMMMTMIMAMMTVMSVASSHFDGFPFQQELTRVSGPPTRHVHTRQNVIDDPWSMQSAGREIPISLRITQSFLPDKRERKTKWSSLIWLRRPTLPLKPPLPGTVSP